MPRNALKYYYCEADREYWRELKTRESTPSIVMKRINSPVDGRRMWVVDGRMTSKGYTDDWLYCTTNGLNRFSTAHSRLSGNRALDICSTYGVSSRAFLDGGHSSVVIVEPEELIADLVIKNLNGWGYQNFEVWPTRDWDQLCFEEFDSIRFGHPDLEMLVHSHTQDILQVNNLIFDVPIGKLTKEILLDAGYTKPLAWNSVQIYSINKVTGDNPNE